MIASMTRWDTLIVKGSSSCSTTHAILHTNHAAPVPAPRFLTATCGEARSVTRSGIPAKQVSLPRKSTSPCCQMTGNDSGMEYVSHMHGFALADDQERSIQEVWSITYIPCRAMKIITAFKMGLRSTTFEQLSHHIDLRYYKSSQLARLQYVWH